MHSDSGDMIPDEKKQFISEYNFVRDDTKPGRVLYTAKVGEVYVSRLEVDPGVVTANFYHKKTNTIMFMEQGLMRMKFVQVNTGEEKEFETTPADEIVHMPPFVATANKNIGDEMAVLMLVSDRPFRSGDDYEYPIYPKTDSVEEEKDVR